MFTVWVRKFFEKIGKNKTYTLEVVFPNGSTYYNNRYTEAEIQIIFKSRKALRRTVIFGYTGLFESYFDGRVDINGEDAITKLIRMGYEIVAPIQNPFVALKRTWLEITQNNRNWIRAKINAWHHYNFPAEFFNLLSCPEGYSEGLWIRGDESLEEAMMNKFRLVCRKLRLNKGDKLIEVGSGLGTLSILAAEEHGAEVINYNPVPEQNKEMRKRIDKKGLGHRVLIEEEDHRAIDEYGPVYDRYVSVGVYEHAGKNCQEEWIRSIARALKEGGIGFISTMAHVTNFPTNYLIIKYIFPGGYIPSLAEISKLMEKYNLEILETKSFRHHYEQAVREWQKRFETNWEKIQALAPLTFTERFRRIWTVYLAGAAECFRAKTETINVFHITFRKGRLTEPLPI